MNYGQAAAGEALWIPAEMGLVKLLFVSAAESQ